MVAIGLPLSLKITPEMSGLLIIERRTGLKPVNARLLAFLSQQLADRPAQQLRPGRSQARQGVGADALQAHPETLGAFYHPDWVADLKALSCATAAVAAKASGADDVRSRLEQVIAAATALHQGTGDDAVGRKVRDLLATVLRAE